MIYLASPYSDSSREVEAKRYEAVRCKAANLLAEGHLVFSPIVYTHHFACDEKLKGDWGAWCPFDKAMIALCSSVWVLKLPGWSESVGVQAEVEFARSIGKVVRFIEQ